jgi:HAD superfamily hydrolase (TIGR01509 family)
MTMNGIRLPEALCAVVFDCDGTLVDSEPLHAKAISLVLGGYGVHMPATMIMSRFTGYDNARLLAEVGTEAGIEWPADIDQRLDDACHRLLLAEASAMPGAVTALDACRSAELTLAVASNSKRRLVTAMLGCARLNGYFDDRLATRDRVSAAKPAADCYLLAAGYCAVPPSRCLAVEDSPAGVRAARAAGMTALGYRPAGSAISIELLRAAGAAGVIEDLHRLALLIEGRPLAAPSH